MQGFLKCVGCGKEYTFAEKSGYFFWFFPKEEPDKKKYVYECSCKSWNIITMVNISIRKEVFEERANSY
jgi:hypothetical protein